jgi:hypothetical protein
MSGAGVRPSLAPGRAGVDETNRVIFGHQSCGAYDGDVVDQARVPALMSGEGVPARDRSQHSKTDQQMSFRSR